MCVCVCSIEYLFSLVIGPNIIIYRMWFLVTANQSIKIYTTFSHIRIEWPLLFTIVSLNKAEIKTIFFLINLGFFFVLFTAGSLMMLNKREKTIRLLIFTMTIIKFKWNKSKIIVTAADKCTKKNSRIMMEYLFTTIIENIYSPQGRSI